VRKQLVHLALVVVLVGVCAGAQCNRSSKVVPSRMPTTSKIEAFKEQQSATMTPHGTIDMKSVRETSDGVEYKTSDGHTWRVVLEWSANGWRPRGEPEEVK
jgi:L-lactate utilization protein LutB